MKRYGMRKLLVFGAVAAVVMGLGFGSVAVADEHESVIEIPVTNVFATGAPGSTVALGQAAVDADLVGQSCSVVATVTNQASEHPGNTLVVTSGTSTVEVAGIEDAANAVTTQAGTLTLGDSISAAVLLGDDGATSLGSSLKVTCEVLPETPPTPPTQADPTYTG